MCRPKPHRPIHSFLLFIQQTSGQIIGCAQGVEANTPSRKGLLQAGPVVSLGHFKAGRRGQEPAVTLSCHTHWVLLFLPEMPSFPRLSPHGPEHHLSSLPSVLVVILALSASCGPALGFPTSPSSSGVSRIPASLPDLGVLGC